MLKGEPFQSNIGRFEKDIRILAEVNSCDVVKTLRDAPLASTLYSAHAAPKRAPTAAVTPIASAPQSVTRIAPTITRAPPARAANPPRSARNTSEVPETTGMRLAWGTAAAVKSGMAAPTAKLPADASAA